MNEATKLFWVLLIISLLMGAISVGGIYTGYIKGEKGDQGLIGQVGPMGMDGPAGDIGDMPTHEWNGTSIRFELPNGTWSEWVNLVGPKGNKGDNGNTGATGPKGDKGDDCPINQIPIVDLVDIDGKSKEEWWGTTYKYNLTVNISDPDCDNIHIDIYYSHDNETWVSLLSDKGIGGEYYVETPWVSNDVRYWLVETWDGQDIGLDYFFYCYVC